jgi:hypothetical protein
LSQQLWFASAVANPPKEEKWAKSITPSDLDRMAYKATNNIAALEDTGQKKNRDLEAS